MENPPSESLTEASSSSATFRGQTWDTAAYAATGRFVADLAGPVVELLNPQPGEAILDLGCGDGELTQRIAASGAAMTGVDSSPTMVAEARARGLNVYEGSIRTAVYESEFDAVFSNAALHWMPDAEAVIAAVHRSLKPGGRFVAEMGGHGNLATQLEGLRAAVFAAGHEAPRLAEHLFFPTIPQYGAILEANGLELRHAMLLDRPTPLDGGEAGLRNWILQFGMHVLEVVPEPQRDAVIRDCESRLRAKLWDGTQWVADYRRLRFVAVNQ